ncbi:hypothetical protein [Aeromonas sp. CU5]|uniref:hypothetical protein n=1 Tax=Aeromonas sp. CU5 TaxID=2033033 RepID=UPI0012FE4AA7|nr:hypothetical protein [Aeromonas sp. CU5]
MLSIIFYRNVTNALVFLLLLSSSCVYAFSLPPMIELPVSQKKMFVAAEGVDNLTQLVVNEVDYPGAQRHVIATSTADLRVKLNVSKKGLLLGWNGAPSDGQERYFEVSLVSGKSSQYRESVTMLVIIPPQNLLMKYNYAGSSFKNNGNGYVVLMENLECGNSIGRSWLVGPGRQLSIPPVRPSSELLVGRGMHMEMLRACK